MNELKKLSDTIDKADATISSVGASLPGFQKTMDAGVVQVGRTVDAFNQTRPLMEKAINTFGEGVGEMRKGIDYFSTKAVPMVEESLKEGIGQMGRGVDVAKEGVFQVTRGIDMAQRVADETLPMMNRGVTAAEEGVAQFTRGVNLAEQNMGGFLKVGNQATTEWGRTNTVVEQVADTFSKPQNIGILLASAAAGAVIGATFAKFAMKGVEMLGRSILNFVRGKYQKEKEEGLLAGFQNAQRQYQATLEIAIMLEKHMDQFLKTIMAIQQNKTARAAASLDQDDILDTMDEVVASLETANDRHMLTIESLRPRLLEEDGQAYQCTIGHKVKMEKNKRQITQMKILKEQIGQGKKYIYPCGVLKDFYKALVMAESTLEQYRSEILVAEDVWMKKHYAQKQEQSRNFAATMKNAAKTSDTGTGYAQQFSRTQADAYLEGLQTEVAACMEEMDKIFSKKYGGGEVNWEFEINLLGSEIKNNFGFIKETDEFSAWTWTETIFGKSWERKYCEMKLYNMPYTDPARGFRIPRIEYYKSQMASIMDGQLAKEKQYSFIQEFKQKNATSLLSAPLLNQESDLAKTDKHFVQILKDQTCYQERSKCDEETLSRITHSRNKKADIVNLCGNIF